VARAVLPHLRDGPFTCKRHSDGPRGRAAPLEEVGPELDPQRFTMAETLRRVEREGDLAGRVLAGRQRLGPPLDACGSPSRGRRQADDERGSPAPPAAGRHATRPAKLIELAAIL
jgi:DNA primase